MQIRFTDVTAESGELGSGYGMGVAIGDIDNDGYPDLYVMNLGNNQLLRNNGDGSFSDVTKLAGVDDPRWSTSAVFLDYDKDGRRESFTGLAANRYHRIEYGRGRPARVRRDAVRHRRRRAR